MKADSPVSLDQRFSVGRFRERLNRFVMRVETETGSHVRCFCPNTSRLIGLLEDRPRVLITENQDPDRKTDFTVRAFQDNDTWVGIEAFRANELFEAYLQRESGVFNDWVSWEREVTHENSQLDFCGLKSRDEREWVEVKSLSSRTSSGRAFYSGTPSKRGYRHLKHLGDLVESGDDARCVFVVQRSDVEALVPAEVSEPGWIRALRKAERRGVAILAFRCAFDGCNWSITDRIPAHL